jgi:predicted amidohydrolase YtcJ
MPDSTTVPPLVIAGARPWTGIVGGPASGEPLDVHVVDGRIAAIEPADRGDGRGGAASGDRRRIDAAGMWLGPGFVDAHVHLVMAGLGLRELDLSAADSREAFERRIAAGAASLDAAGAGPDAWLVARGWDESRWGGERPTAAWLRAAGERPAAAWRMDIHAAVVNPAGLAKLDLREPVPGGTIIRDAAGEPSGLLLEAAAWTRLIPALPPPTPEAERAAVVAAEAHAHSRGLVAVGSMEYLDVIERALVPGAADRTLAIRLLALDRDLPLAVDRMRAVPASATLRLFAAKAFVDGTLGSRTARMLAPYADIAPGEAEPRGLLVERAADGTLSEWARAAVAGGLGVAIHAIGDEAVRLALDAMDAADATTGRPTASGRPPVMRIEHAQHVDAVDLPRVTGRFASVQPGHRIGDRAVMDARLGAARAAASFPLRELAAAGATLAFGSDWPVIDCDPMDAIAAAVVGMTREGPRADGHEIDVAAAIHAHTVDAWRSIDEPQRGRLEAGAAADLVLLDRDPAATDWTRERPRVALTMAGGRVVFEA